MSEKKDDPRESRFKCGDAIEVQQPDGSVTKYRFKQHIPHTGESDGQLGSMMLRPENSSTFPKARRPGYFE